MTHRVPNEVFDGQPSIDADVTNRAFWEQAFERAFKTAIQNAVVFFTSVPIINIDWQQALTATGVTVVLSFLMSILSSRLYVFDSFLQDTAQRAGRTFIATFLGALAGLDALNVEDWKQAAILGAGAAALSVMTSGVSKNLGTPGTASVLPGADLVPAVQQVITYADAVGQAAQPYVDQANTFMQSLNRPGR